MPSWTDDLLRLLTLRDANTRTVLIGTGLLGLAAAVVGSLGVMRRRALVGDAVAHAALPGVCLAFFVVGGRSFPAFLAGALICGVLAAGVIAFIRSYSRIKEDAAIGIVIGSFFGLGIVLSRIIQSDPNGNQAGLDGFIFGKAASMVASDARLIAFVAAGVLLVVALLYKELKLLCFDRGFADSLGRPTGLLDLGLMSLICLCTVAGLPAVGIVLMVALLITPGVAARCWTDRLSVMLVIAGGIGLLSGVVGTALSATLPAPMSSLSRGWPTGPMIVLVASLCFVISLLFAPRRGLVPEYVRHARLRFRIAQQNLLRAAHEHAETDIPHPLWTPADLPALRAWSPLWTRVQLASARTAGFIARDDHHWRLTDEGESEARRIVRAHRLWELFLIEHADIAPDHVDRDADEIEHFLPADLLARLEARIAIEDALPRSPHPLEGVPMP